MLCASFVVQSISERLLCLNAFVSQVSMCKNFLRLMFFWCKRLLSDSKSFLACRTAKMSWDELQGDEKGWSVPGWDENSWEEPYSDDMRWGEKSSHDLRWDEVSSAKCKCEVQVWSVKRALWSVRKVFAWRCIAPGSCAGHVLGQQHCNSFAQNTQARAWLAHGACKFYRWERSYNISLRQLPPRLVRVQLVDHSYWS